MDTQKTGKALYVVLALVFIALIAGGTTWFYLMGARTTPVATTTTTDTSKTAVADPKVDTKTELASSVDAIDDDLAAITNDEESSDDIVDF